MTDFVCLYTYEFWFPLEDCSEFGNFVITLINIKTYRPEYSWQIARWTLNTNQSINQNVKWQRSFFSFFFIEIENFRGEGKILMRHTHDTTFFEKNLDFYKILEESEQFFIFFS